MAANREGSSRKTKPIKLVWFETVFIIDSVLHGFCPWIPEQTITENAANEDAAPSEYTHTKVNSCYGQNDYFLNEILF